MRFYKNQHQFYCGIDLHARSLYVCLIDHDGTKHVHRNFPASDPRKLLDALQAFRNHELIVGCESTFNWYWLADFC